MPEEPEMTGACVVVAGAVMGNMSGGLGADTICWATYEFPKWK